MRLLDQTKEMDHGVMAAYSGGPGEPYYQPILDCLCGFSTGRCPNWETAGSLMDQHIDEITRSN